MRDSASGELVTVRAFRPDDANGLHEAVLESVVELSRFETWCRPGYTRSEAAEYVGWWLRAWKEGRAYYFSVRDPRTDEFLGSCGLSDLSVEHKRAALGFWVRSSRTGAGIATDAARTVVRFGFEDLGLERIEIEASVDNPASRRIAEKLGGRLEGILRRRLVLPAGPTDTAMYSILRAGGV